VGDFYLARWKNGTEVQRFEDPVYKSLTPADLKQ
jgi:branched-chain amino acid transport system substrate-binding protein